MDFKRLKYFLTLAEELHFGRAAKRLNIVQPALSAQIRNLEEELGGLLFVRTSRQVELTSTGELCLQQVRQLFQQLTDLKEMAQASFKGELGKIRVGFSSIVAFTDFFSGHIKRFQDNYPKVEIIMHEVPPLYQIKALLAGKIDVGYASLLGLEKNPDLSARLVGVYPFVVAMRKDHPLAGRGKLAHNDLKDEKIIIYSSEDNDEFNTLTTHLMRSIEDYNVDYFDRRGSLLSMLTLVAAGQGIAIMPCPVQSIKASDVIYIPLAETEASTSFFMIRRAQEASPAVHAFWDFTGA